MATFNGFTIIPLPSTPSAPASVEFTAMDTVAASTSPFTGQQQIQNWQASWLEASVSLPAMPRATAEPWIAFLLALQGSANIFQIGDPLGASPRGSGLGSPAVRGAGQSGYALSTQGWTASSPKVLRAGDYLQIGHRLYRNLVDADADGAGHSLLSIWPQLRESPADADAITLNNTVGVFRLKSNARKWSLNPNRFYGMQFECREAI